MNIVTHSGGVINRGVRVKKERQWGPQGDESQQK